MTVNPVAMRTTLRPLMGLSLLRSRLRPRGARPRAASVMLPAPGVSRPLRAQKSPVLLRTAVLSLEQPNRQAFRPNGVSGASGVASATRSPLPSVRLRPRRVR